MKKDEHCMREWSQGWKETQDGCFFKDGCFRYKSSMTNEIIFFTKKEDGSTHKLEKFSEYELESAIFGSDAAGIRGKLHWLLYPMSWDKRCETHVLRHE